MKLQQSVRRFWGRVHERCGGDEGGYVGGNLIFADQRNTAHVLSWLSVVPEISQFSDVKNNYCILSHHIILYSTTDGRLTKCIPRHRWRRYVTSRIDIISKSANEKDSLAPRITTIYVYITYNNFYAAVYIIIIV